MMKRALALAASLLTLAFSVDAQAVDVGIVSNNTDIWSVSETHLDSMGNPVTTDLGKPQHVCLNAPSNPPSCPTGATSYGYTLPGWTASLSNLPPNAAWIWASKQPDGTPITGATTGAANAEFSFKARFFLCGNQPQDGTIWVAADNSVEVFVNGAPTPVLTWNDHSVVGTITIPAASLKAAPTPNVIELKIKNGANPSDCGSNQYQCNPAGVVFGGRFSDELTALPTCTNPPGNVNDSPRNLGLCPSPQTGSKFSSCICLAGNAGWFDWDKCMSPPQPANCGSRSVSWVVGSSTCDASYPGGQSGTSATVTDSTAPTTGTATASCSNGTVTATVASCVTAPPPPANCASTSVSWTVGSATCGASYPGGQSGTSATVADSTPPTTGTATASCSNGTVSTTAASCVTATGCTGDDGSIFNVGQVETSACPGGASGRQSRTCQADLTWGPFSGSVAVGAVCGSTGGGLVACCPSGTECQRRLGPAPPRDFWCSFLRIGCRPRLWSTEFFCDPIVVQ